MTAGSALNRPAGLFLAPWLIVFALFWLYPLAFSLILSFCDYNVFHPESWRFIGLDNFLRLPTDGRFLQSLSNTLIFALGTTPVTTLFGLLLALLVNHQRIGERLFRSAFFLPSILSVVVISTVFKSIYSFGGLLNLGCSWVGLPPQAWLADPQLALFSIMAMDVWAATGYSLVLLLAALKAIPEQVYQAAEVDGATPWQTFRFITLPLLRPMLLFVIILNTIRSWQVFPEIFTMTRGGPLGTTDTMVYHLYEVAFRSHEMGYASAMAYLLLIIIFVLSALQMKALGRTTE